jgi:DNA polymerase-1
MAASGKTEGVVLPNIRKMFIPDPGYIIYDADLAGADAQVVAWEAEDEDLKAAFRAGLDVHSHNAEALFGTRFTSLTGTKRYQFRQKSKQGVHLTNYGGSARAMAKVLGWTVRECDDFQKRWFSIRPGIKRWHQRIETELLTTRSVTNKFGYRRIYFDRIDAVLPEALAWVPQSTVALTTYYGADQLEEQIPQSELLSQVHDSLVFQIPKSAGIPDRRIRDSLANPIPYDDPLIIQWGLAKSEISWGDCKDIDFKEAA